MNDEIRGGNREDLELDVRDLPPRERHPKIFSLLEQLGNGQALILINDHDPKPLYYQLNFEQPDKYDWEPLESGPEAWRIRIGKR